MAQSSADVKTENGSKYLQQLCKHWSHKMQTECDVQKGRVDFPSGAQLLLSAEPTVLHLELKTESAESLARMQGVVADHLARFAFREELVFDWVAAAT